MRFTHDEMSDSCRSQIACDSDDDVTRDSHWFIVRGGAGASGCAAGQAFRNGNAAMKAGDLDQAVAYYRKAAQASPDNPNYKIALQRAMLAASRAHLEKAQRVRREGSARSGARRVPAGAANTTPSNRQAAAKVARSIRRFASASKRRGRGRRSSSCASARAPRRPSRCSTRRRASRCGIDFTQRQHPRHPRRRSATPPASTSPTTRGPPTATTVQLDGVTLEQALKQIMTINQLSYKVISERSILVFPDTAQKHAQYDEQVVQTFYVSHADVTELTQLLSTIIRLPSMAVQPAIQFNKTANTITVRGTASVVQIIEQDHRAERQAARRDRVRHRDPRGRIAIAREEVRLEPVGIRARRIFSPEVSPSGTTITSRAPARRHRDRHGTTTTTTAARRRRRAACSRRRRST